MKCVSYTSAFEYNFFYKYLKPNVLPCCGDGTQPVPKANAMESLIASSIITSIVSPASTVNSQLIIYIKITKVNDV